MYRRQRRGLACLVELFICLIASGHLCAQATAQAQLSAYNPSFGAPACLELGTSCRTDDDMIAGVASFELNSPNTIDNCTDKSNAVYRQDEYVNRIIVRQKDSGTMTAGKWLEIHATVSKAADVSSRLKPDAKEVAHIYYASESLGESSFVI